MRMNLVSVMFTQRSLYGSSPKRTPRDFYRFKVLRLIFDVALQTVLGNHFTYAAESPENSDQNLSLIFRLIPSIEPCQDLWPGLAIARFSVATCRLEATIFF